MRLRCLLFLLPVTVFSAVTTEIYYRCGEDGVVDYGAPRDSSGNQRHMTFAYSNVVTSTSAPGAFSTSSIYLDGTNWISTVSEKYMPYITNNVGVECWVRATKVNQTNAYVFGTGWASDGSGLAVFYDRGSNGFYGCLPKVTNFTAGYLPASTNEWVHLAIVRDNGVTKFYVNGTNFSSTTTAVPFFCGYEVLRISDLHYEFAGHYDEYRLFTFTGAFDNKDLLCYSVTNKPQIIANPWALYHTQDGTNVIATHGDIVQFMAPMLGSSPVSRWYTNGVLAASTSNKLSVSVATNLSGLTAYYTASNSFGVVTSGVAGITVLNLIAPTQSTNPSSLQLAKMQRAYGMFVHFGINTFSDGVAPEYYTDWTDGTVSSTTFNLTNLVDTDQWAQTAVNAGMKQITLTSKHHDGFCLWPSKYTAYSVASSGGLKQDVVYSLAKSCDKYNLGFGLYYSLWDRHQSSTNMTTYWPFLTNQLTELLTGYGPVCELFLDGAWTHYPTKWHLAEVYHLVKTFQPNCTVTVNNTLGTTETWDVWQSAPGTGVAGTPVAFWPADYRTRDPFIVPATENKLYQAMTLPGSRFYMPFESMSILDAGGVTNGTAAQWFWHEGHTNVVSVASLLQYYTNAVAGSNICLFNASPDRTGKIPAVQSNLLYQFRTNVQVALPTTPQRKVLRFQ